ncbi:MAG: 4-(cytidine 5'-diphospho)-2-C-methyl-D-erythritol kinase, partial [Parasphingorhabdus sp.]|nr:4-(cytidine 5'-diphospho)-2-C-methyl-D-erythritol kinase [Parasphingorhabdus sp.]
MSGPTETAYAKINLALHVRGRRADGYHDIETLFAFVDAGDQLSATPALDISLTFGGQFGSALSAEDNLVLAAADVLRREAVITAGAALHLEKNLPIASGIGGGSADAAAALRLLNRLWDIGYSDDKLAEIAAPLGADVPACLYSKTQLGQGTGQDLKPVEIAGLQNMPVLLVNPLMPVSTAAIR